MFCHLFLPDDIEKSSWGAMQTLRSVSNANDDETLSRELGVNAIVGHKKGSVHVYGLKRDGVASSIRITLALLLSI